MENNQEYIDQLRAYLREKQAAKEKALDEKLTRALLIRNLLRLELETGIKIGVTDPEGDYL